MNNYRGTKSCIIILVLLLMSFSTRALGQAVSDEAKRHFDRGTIAVEMANSPADYAPAIREFEQAVSLAPNWPNAYYSLGKAQEKAGKFGDAAISYKQYLRLAPNASDADTIKTLINKLEYKSEQEDKYQNVYNIMTSKLYTRHQTERKILSGDYGRGLSYGPLFLFRIESGKMEAKNFFGSIPYSPQYHPPIPREWEPVKVNGKFYEYTYSSYMDMASSYVNRMDNEVKGEIISIDPPRVREIVKCSVTWGAPLERNMRPWNSRNNMEEVIEYTYDYVVQ